MYIYDTLLNMQENLYEFVMGYRVIIKHRMNTRVINA